MDKLESRRENTSSLNDTKSVVRETTDVIDTSSHDELIKNLTDKVLADNSKLLDHESNDGLLPPPLTFIIDPSLGDDEFSGTDGDDFIYHTAGNDTIYAGAGDDTIILNSLRLALPDFASDWFNFGATVHAGDGNDFIQDIGNGNDTIYAGNGDDIVIAGGGDDRVYGEAGDDTIYGGDGNDLLSGGTGSDKLDGGAGNDVLLGGDGDDYLTGGAGNDTLNGGAGNDQLFGGDGFDFINGGAGNDHIWVNDDSGDAVLGGAGADYFYMFLNEESGNTVSFDVFDFNAAEGDKLIIRKYDSVLDQSNGYDYLHNYSGFLGGDSDGSNNQLDLSLLSITQMGGNTIINYDGSTINLIGYTDPLNFNMVQPNEGDIIFIS